MRINDLRSFGSCCIKKRSIIPTNDSSVPFMHHDPSALESRSIQRVDLDQDPLAFFICHDEVAVLLTDV